MPGISPGSIGSSRHLPLGKGPDMNLLLRHATPLPLFPAFAAAQEFSTVYCPCQRGTKKKGTFKQKKGPEADICFVHVQLKKILERRHFNFIELTPSLTFLAWCSNSSVFMSALCQLVDFNTIIINIIIGQESFTSSSSSRTVTRPCKKTTVLQLENT